MHLQTPLVSLDEAERRNARTFSRAMLLRGGPKSPLGTASVDMIVDEIVAPYQSSRGQLRPSSVKKYREICGPFLADLLFAASLGTWSKLQTKTNALPNLPGGSKAFRTMRSSMGAEGLLEELPGYVRKFSLQGEAYTKAARTSFRPSEKLLNLLAGFGIPIEDVPDHFSVGRPPEPEPASVLEKRAEKANKGSDAKRLAVDPEDPKAAAIIADLARLNAHLMVAGRIEGIAFAGLRRVFSNADRPGFNWQWHGRFYSMPEADSYERMEGGGATRCKVIRIDGQAVQEVDIRAAHLTILHGLLGLPFDDTRDPYEAYDLGPKPIDGQMPSGRLKLPQISERALVDREKVKAWLLLALGASDCNVGGPRHNKARRAGLMRYPFLADLPNIGIGTLDLQYHEAEIIRLAMETLMEKHDVGFLPVHDALMVAETNIELAKEAMRDAFRRYFKETLGMPRAPVPILS